jgi:hypothetical protein
VPEHSSLTIDKVAALVCAFWKRTLRRDANQLGRKNFRREKEMAARLTATSPEVTVESAATSIARLRNRNSLPNEFPKVSPNTSRTRAYLNVDFNHAYSNQDAKALGFREHLFQSNYPLLLQSDDNEGSRAARGGCELSFIIKRSI